MKEMRFWVHCATLGPVGYLVAPGTIATFLTLPVIFWLRRVVADVHSQLLLLVCAFFIGVGIIHLALKQLKTHEDPSEVVLDEVIGCLVVFWAIPLTLPTVAIGFLLFRFFDIAKILGIKYVERLPGGWGVMMDDVIAGVVVNILLRLVF